MQTTEKKPIKSSSKPNSELAQLNPQEQVAIDRINAWLDQRNKQEKTVDDAGLVRMVEEPGGHRSRYFYDETNELVKITEPNGRSTNFEYDTYRRLIRVDHDNGNLTRYTYGENDRLAQIDDAGVVSRFEYDASGRPTKICVGNSGATIYRYDHQGRVVEARTPEVSTQESFDPAGRVETVRQRIGDHTLEIKLEYHATGLLKNVVLPGFVDPVDYRWDANGRLDRIRWGDRWIADYEYGNEKNTTCVRFANGISQSLEIDPIDCRPVRWEVTNAKGVVTRKENRVNVAGQLIDDGRKRYAYDEANRLIAAQCQDDPFPWRFRYDGMDNRVESEENGRRRLYHYDGDNRLYRIDGYNGEQIRILYDRHGRPEVINQPDGAWQYRYNDAGLLREVSFRGDWVSRFVYDHKARLVLSRHRNGTERYLYGPEDQLLAVTDESGALLRAYVSTPYGPVCEIRSAQGIESIYFLHLDDQDTCHLITDMKGRVVADFEYDPYGKPYYTNSDFRPMFKNKFWHPRIEMYDFGARWYDPHLGRFLTPDSYTGRPDDARIFRHHASSRSQAIYRAKLLANYLTQPRVRNRYAFCGNDPLNRFDPDGHWAAGWWILSVLGAIWTLPNTAIGLFLEATCVIGEVLRVLIYLISFGNVSWEPLGAALTGSSRLHAFAVVFEGGWLGSIPRLRGITFGNIIFAYKKWQDDPFFTKPGDVFPPAYCNRISIPRDQAFYEHELRHTNQYAWFGPLFLLVYVFDAIVHRLDSRTMWLERDARKHSGYPEEA